MNLNEETFEDGTLFSSSTIVVVICVSSILVLAVVYHDVLTDPFSYDRLVQISDSTNGNTEVVTLSEASEILAKSTGVKGDESRLLILNNEEYSHDGVSYRLISDAAAEKYKRINRAD